MFGVFGRQPPKASAREVALETENSALKAEVAALRRRLGEDNDEQASTDDKSPASKAATPKTAKPRAETQAATGTKRARDEAEHEAAEDGAPSETSPQTCGKKMVGVKRWM